MTVEFAIDYIPRRMRELGFSEYMTRWRHFYLDAGASLHIDADNEYFILIDPDAAFNVKSKFGSFNLNDHASNEMQYEHRGKIDILNNADTPKLLLFIQVIPNNPKKNNHGCSECGKA